MSNKMADIQKLLIAGITPTLLEKSVAWFLKNEKNILRYNKINSWWNRNTVFVEKDQIIKPSEFLRTLSELGYQKTLHALRKGEFWHQGSIITIFPINRRLPFSVEFTGNQISSIEARKIVKHRDEFTVLETTKNKIKPGDFVVHLDHGVGVFRGLVNHPQTSRKKYFEIEYASPQRKNAPADTLLVPISKQQKISPYIGFRTPIINRLGTPLWKRTKKKAEEEIFKFAKELLHLYQTRIAQKRAVYTPDSLENGVWLEFPFQETRAQEKSLAEILKDLSGEKPMERLLVGDVGFGKTELALRAALRVALNGKQVVLVSPTTVLCEQHTALFKKRLNNLPINIERLSRLETKTKAKKVIQTLKEGKTDIVISTHRIFSKDIAFKNLGLLIIDEEQRFGVKQKERVKELYPNVDILLLSATPIPRTLSLALANIRSMSLLDEAPPKRLAPLTFIAPRSTKLIKDAIKKELGREGQVYFLADRIKSIPRIIEFLDKLFPKIKKGVLHGRLSEQKIIETMQKFRMGQIKILVSTTIIENGLDISQANTLIIENSSRLGLADSHQLRGRIGRGEKQAYAYFLYRPKSLTEKGEERLKALEGSAYLGAGFDLAKKDLELRGAGNILGREQSGTVNRIGWNLYYEILTKTLRGLNSQHKHQ